MSINKELDLPLGYSWNIMTVLLEVMAILVLMYTFYDYFWKIIKNYITMPRIPHLKDRYIKKLEKLGNDVNDNSIDVKEAYYHLSKIIREFIDKSTGIKVLNLTKEEIKKIGINELSLLMEEYYPPEFSEYSDSNIANSIMRTIELIKKWE